MSKLPIVDARTMDRILRALGFSAVRQKGVTFSIAISIYARGYLKGVDRMRFA